MNQGTEKLLYLLGGVALGSLAVLALSNRNNNLRPILTDLASGALDLKDKTIGAVQRGKEDLTDFMAEVEHARATKNQAEKEPTPSSPASA
jgi:hypothetical protein